MGCSRAASTSASVACVSRKPSGIGSQSEHPGPRAEFPSVEYPHIPGIDFSGTVEESESNNFKPGDKVILTGWRVGEIYYGGYSQYAKVQDSFLVKLPKDLDTKKAMILGTAGLTALMCVLIIQARETILKGDAIKDVLVTGATGGVGSVAVLALSKLGYNVHAVTEGTDAQATVSVRIEEKGKTTVGQAADTDTLVASANAYLSALNKLIIKRKKTKDLIF